MGRNILLRQGSATAPWKVGVSGLVGLAVGLLLVHATLGEGREALAPAGETQQGDSAVEPPSDIANPESTAAQDTDAPSDAEAVDPSARVAEDIAAETSAEDAVSDDTAVEAPPVEAVDEQNPPVDAGAPAALPSGAQDARFTRGRLAYLRCGSLADADGRCPRDRTLESEAWRRLEAASTRCQLGGGSGDVRIHFGVERDVRFRDFGDRPLSTSALNACLEPHLSTLTSELNGSFVLSLRFELR